MTPPWFELLGCREAPFAKDFAPGEVWVPRSLQATFDAALEALALKYTVSITGESGGGKTSLLRAIRHALHGEAYRLSYCHNATLGRRDFYRQLCLALGLAPAATAAGVFYAVTTHVETLARDRIHPIFVLDEAHLLHQDTLDHLHILLNYEWDARALLSLVLVGLPDLDTRLALRRNRSLQSRVQTRLHIPPPVRADTADYVRYRLGRVGADPGLFRDDAVALLHDHTAGTMRDIDRHAVAALRLAARRALRAVDAALLDEVLDTAQRGES